MFCRESPQAPLRQHQRSTLLSPWCGAIFADPEKRGRRRWAL